MRDNRSRIRDEDSPIAKALMKVHEGDIVDLRAPAGVDQIEVLAIRYSVADSKLVRA